MTINQPYMPVMVRWLNHPWSPPPKIIFVQLAELSTRRKERKVRGVKR